MAMRPFLAAQRTGVAVMVRRGFGSPLCCKKDWAHTLERVCFCGVTFGAWQHVPALQALGARQVGAGGGPHQELFADLTFQRGASHPLLCKEHRGRCI